MAITGYGREAVINAVATALDNAGVFRLVEYGPQQTFEAWLEDEHERYPAIYIEAREEEYTDLSTVQFAAHYNMRIFCIWDYNAEKNSLSLEDEYIKAILNALLADPTLGGNLSDLRPESTDFDIPVENPVRGFAMDWTCWSYFTRP